MAVTSLMSASHLKLWVIVVITATIDMPVGVERIVPQYGIEEFYRSLPAVLAGVLRWQLATFAARCRSQQSACLLVGGPVALAGNWRDFV